MQSVLASRDTGEGVWCARLKRKKTGGYDRGVRAGHRREGGKEKNFIEK